MSAKDEESEVGGDRAEGKEDSERAESKDDKGDVPVPKLSGSALIEKVQEYFYGDEDLAKLFESFVAGKSSCVDLDSTEFKLEYTAAYEEYKALFELKIGGYIERVLGATIEEFYSAIQLKSLEDEWGNEAIFAQILIGVTEFDVFMQMMREGKKGNKVSHK
jgi:hypothetical protein